MTAKGDEQIARAEQQRAQMARYEADNDRVPGTCSHDGKEPRGGVEWEGRARMALARQTVGLPLDVHDLEAIRRHPNPASGLTGSRGRSRS